MNRLSQYLLGAAAVGGALFVSPPATAAVVTTGCYMADECTLADLDRRMGGGSFSIGTYSFGDWGTSEWTRNQEVGLNEIIIRPYEDMASGVFGFDVFSRPYGGMDNAFALQGLPATALRLALGLSYEVRQSGTQPVVTQQVLLKTADGAPRTVSVNAGLQARGLDWSPLGFTGASCWSFPSDPSCASQTVYSVPAKDLPAYAPVNNNLGFKSDLTLEMTGGFPDPNAYFGVEMLGVRYSNVVPEPTSASMLLFGLAAAGFASRRRQGRG